MNIKSAAFIFLIGFLSFLAGCGGGGGSAVIPSDDFVQVGSYAEIPDDFFLIYDFRDENAQPPYRLVLIFNKAGVISYEKYIVTATGFDLDTEDSLLTSNDVLALYNYMISKGFFDLAKLYTTPDLSKPITAIEVDGKSKEVMVEYHACPDCVEDNLPAVFNEIVAFIINLGAKYLQKM